MAAKKKTTSKKETATFESQNPRPPEVQRVCNNCAYYNEPDMQCRRFPPIPVFVYGAVIGHWPTAHKGNYCGEFKAV